MKTRDEALYNLAQENEIFIFFGYLPRVAYFVCKNDSLWKRVGAPPAKLYDVLMNLSIKQYFGRSLRRSIGLIKAIRKAFKLDLKQSSLKSSLNALIKAIRKAFKLDFKLLCFKTLDNYLNNPCVRNYLDEIIRYTSNPLKFLEKNFATDKTG